MLSLDLSQAKSRRLIALLISGALVISLITGTVIYVAVRNSTRAAANEHQLADSTSSEHFNNDAATKAYQTKVHDDNFDEKSKESSEEKDLDTSEEEDSTSEEEDSK